MPDRPLDMLVVRLPDGTFADALQAVRIVQNGFKSRSEAEKFIEDYYLARHHRAALNPKSIDQFWTSGRSARGAQGAAVTRGGTMKLTNPPRKRSQSASSAGTYTGASAEMSIAAGLGANVLVGGSNHTLALQPLSVQGQIELDIAAGVGSLDLHPSW